VRVLIAPDKFKDALSAPAAAAALADGVRRARPDAEVIVSPVGDGGEGTGAILAAARGAREHTLTVRDPLGRPRAARWWLADDATRTAIVEMAEASGLALLAPAERDPLRTSSCGTGELLRAAVAAGAGALALCVGGSATVDGGAGCLQALGWDLLDETHRPLPAPLPGGRLPEIRAVRAAADGTARLPAIRVLRDVDNPLLGPNGAAAVFGPQKGATPEAIALLEAGLRHWAGLLRRTFGRDVTRLAGGGAAGGLPAGLSAAYEVRLVPGFAEVAATIGLADKLAGVDLCLTGEGRMDGQSARGKAAASVARLARAFGVPTVALVGAAMPDAGQSLADLARAVGVARIVVISPEGVPREAALAATAENLAHAAAAVVREWEARG